MHVTDAEAHDQEGGNRGETPQCIRSRSVFDISCHGRYLY